MGRTKRTEDIKPEDTTPLSLLRVEERNEAVPITDEQKAERLAAAGAKIADAEELDRELVEAKETVKDLKSRAESKHYEAESIVKDALRGMMQSPYPVIVERGKGPAEMHVWRVPAGFEAADLLAPEGLPLEGEPRIQAREAQGCILIETRAMSSEELAVAQEEDRKEHELRNPPLPFDAVAGAAPAATEAGAAQASEGAEHRCLGCSAGPGEEHGMCDDAGTTMPTLEELQATAVRAEELAGTANAGGDASPAVAPTKRTKPPCPYVHAEHDDPRQDEICGKDGSTRARGFCAEHYAELGGQKGSARMTSMLARRTRRRDLEEDAARAAKAPVVTEQETLPPMHGDGGGSDDLDEAFGA